MISLRLRKFGFTPKYARYGSGIAPKGFIGHAWKLLSSAIWTPHQKITFSTEADEFISKSEMPEHVAKCQALVAPSIRV